MPKTNEEARAQLVALGLNPDSTALDAPAKAGPTVRLAPEGVDPRMMPVSDIEFDPALLDDFPSLEGQGFAAASRHVFDLYKSSFKNTDRHRRLHDEIGLFIQRVRRSRETGTEHVKHKVKSTKKQRDLIALLAEHGIESVDDLRVVLTKEEAYSQ